MRFNHYILYTLILLLLFSCQETRTSQTVSSETEKPVIAEAPFVWEAANIYFLLTDRFKNGDTLNDLNFGRNQEARTLRGFEGGDLKGVTQKIEEGYFTDLGINAIWMTPIVEQIHGATDEGTGLTYAFHGYWAKDWTALDPNFGTREDLRSLVNSAHARGIRVILDAVINHRGPVTEKDPVWPESWVRTGPPCTYDSYENTISCTLVENLPDIKTESDENVALPPQLVEKWKAEGRYDEEVAELDAFFERTGHPRAPRFYIMKWLSDYISDFGIDGYRVDTVKHTESYVWQEFKKECEVAFQKWKEDHQDAVLDQSEFYLVGEVYNYGISTGKAFDFGDKKVDYFDQAFDALINFELKWNAAQMPVDAVFQKYSDLLNTDLNGYSVLNYLSSHDDGQPFDAKREQPYNSANLLLLSPGASQIYYGDESARSLVVEGAQGDATLRSNMNWEAIEKDSSTQKILRHWQKLGQFRSRHPAIGAGVHLMISQTPYVFKRTYRDDDWVDEVIVAMQVPKGKKSIDVSSVFKDGMTLRDAYSNQTAEVSNGAISFDTNFDILLLERL